MWNYFENIRTSHQIQYEGLHTMLWWNKLRVCKGVVFTTHIHRLNFQNNTSRDWTHYPYFSRNNYLFSSLNTWYDVSTHSKKTFIGFPEWPKQKVSPGPSSTQPGQKRKRLKDKESWPQPQRGQQLQSGWNVMKLWMPLKSVKGNNPQEEPMKVILEDVG